MTLVEESSAADVRIILKSGKIIEAPSFREDKDFTADLKEGGKLYIGKSIIANGTAYPLSTVAKIVVKKRKIEEVVLWSSTSNANPIKKQEVEDASE